MLKLIVSMLTFSCLACHAEEVSMDYAVIENVKLEILERNDSCSLQVTKNETSSLISLTPKPPCFFLRRGSNEPQQFEYPDVGVQAVLIVTGSPITDAQREEWSLSKTQLCGTESQGILLYEDKVRASGNTLQGGVTCKHQGSDEKDFWGFAHKE